MKDTLSLLKDAMKTPNLTNEDLSVIVTGGDHPPSVSLFLSTFTKEILLIAFAVLVTPLFTRACLQRKYIRHELNKI